MGIFITLMVLMGTWVYTYVPTHLNVYINYVQFFVQKLSFTKAGEKMEQNIQYLWVYLWCQILVFIKFCNKRNKSFLKKWLNIRMGGKDIK